MINYKKYICTSTYSLNIFILYINTPVQHYLLVTTGHVEVKGHVKVNGVTEDTEVVNIFPYEAQVPTYKNHEIALESATGGWVGNNFIVCGGYDGHFHRVSHDKSVTYIG